MDAAGSVKIGPSKAETEPMPSQPQSWPVLCRLTHGQWFMHPLSRNRPAAMVSVAKRARTILTSFFLDGVRQGTRLTLPDLRVLVADPIDGPMPVPVNHSPETRTVQLAWIGKRSAFPQQGSLA
jgi:hypothetical protein